MDGDFKGLFDQANDDQDDEGRGQRGVSGFSARYGWHYNIELVAEYERIPLAEVYELTATNFLNDLAYLKAKRLDEQQRRIEHGAKY